MDIFLSDIQRYSLHDGTGIRTNVFFKGCPLRCKWCANPETQNSFAELMHRKEMCIGCGACVRACPKGLDAFGGEGCLRCMSCAEACVSGAKEAVGKRYTVSQIISEAERDRMFYRKSGGGVTFSGGEPFMQSEGLEELARECKKRGVSTAVETCGAVSFDNMKNALEHLDEILYDVKIMDNEKHIRYTGYGNKQILGNLRTISKLYPERVTVRVPLIAGVNADMENTARLVAFMLENGLKRADLLPAHGMGEKKYALLGREYREKFTAPDEQTQSDICKHFEKNGIKARLNG